MKSTRLFKAARALSIRIIFYSLKKGRKRHFSDNNNLIRYLSQQSFKCNKTMRQPIKVLHIIPQIGIGGAETQLCMLIANSNPELTVHEVLYYGDSSDQRGYELYHKHGVNITRIPRSRRKPIQFLMNLKKEIHQRHPDIVHCWLVSGNFWGRLAAVLAGVQHIVVAWRNCDLWNPLGSKICEWLTTKKIHHLANSKACACYIAKRLRIPTNRFKVIHNGLDIQSFHVSSRKEKLFGHLNIPSDYKIVTMVGRLMAQKNYPMFIETVKKAKDAGLPLFFIVAGVGDLREELLSYCKQLNVEDKIAFIGLRDDVPNVLASSDIFLFTTAFEGFPNALLEAMAAGLPIVTTNFLGVDELIEQNINGKIVRMGEIDAAVDALKFYLDFPQKALEYGEKALKTVSNKYSIQNMVEETMTYYKNITEAKGNA